MFSSYWVLLVSCMVANAAIDPNCQNEERGKIVDIQKKAGSNQCSIRVCEEGVKSGTGSGTGILTTKCKKLLSEWKRIGGSRGKKGLQKSCSYRKKMFKNLSVVDAKKKRSGRVKITICVNGKVVRNFSFSQEGPTYRFGIEAWNPFGK
eukprot:Seg6538.1 transcript_id=Seg6538.1/GoldUCD/mRNA.D3Y31 product="hypothetical protein" protein_id=Seg6538.1/GoldUCD/D3Y31